MLAIPYIKQRDEERVEVGTYEASWLAFINTALITFGPAPLPSEESPSSFTICEKVGIRKKEIEETGNAYPEQGIEAMFIIESFFWRLGKIALEADHDDFYRMHALWARVHRIWLSFAYLLDYQPTLLYHQLRNVQFQGAERGTSDGMKDVPILPAAANFQAGASLPAPKSFLLSS